MLQIFLFLVEHAADPQYEHATHAECAPHTIGLSIYSIAHSDLNTDIKLGGGTGLYLLLCASYH